MSDYEINEIVNFILNATFVGCILLFVWFLISILILLKIRRIEQKINFLIGNDFEEYYDKRKQYRGR